MMGERRLEGFDRKPVDFDRIVCLADRAPCSTDIHFWKHAAVLGRRPVYILDVPVHA